VIMPLRYSEAPDVKKLIEEIVDSLCFYHVVPHSVFCVRSKGSKSRRTIARIHGLGSIWQKTLRLQPSYIIEVISERYDRLTEADKEKTMIHELLHIPKGFSGAFRPHKGYVDRTTVERLYRTLLKNRTIERRRL